MKNSELTTEDRFSRLIPLLLNWFRENARDLPWRHTNDAYRIWISEIMLQQTRVAAVLGYYDRFLKAFPSVEALAAAPEDVLLKLWEGLGYYSRARNLQKTARIVSQQYGGQFPASYQSLVALPGIGDYTASAICSAAFGLPEPAVDGNVLRIFTRIANCHDDIANAKTKRNVRALLAAVMPRQAEQARIFNQAAMELGATVCVPNGPPNCADCPARELCLGRELRTAEQLPVKAPKPARIVEEHTIYLLIRENGTVALRKRPDSGLLAGLWEFPGVPGTLAESAASAPVENWGLCPEDWRKRLNAKHLFTHREWHMTGYVLTVSGIGPEEFLWADLQTLHQLAVPSAFAKYKAEALALLSE